MIGSESLAQYSTEFGVRSPSNSEIDILTHQIITHQ